jgi:hypothetical protein
MQEVAGNHGVAMWGRSDMGFATDPIMVEHNLIFVVTRMQIRMDAYPQWCALRAKTEHALHAERLHTPPVALFSWCACLQQREQRPAHCSAQHRRQECRAVAAPPRSHDSSSPGAACVGCRGDLVSIETWFQKDSRISFERNWDIRDVKSGRRLGMATRCCRVLGPTSSQGVLVPNRQPGTEWGCGVCTCATLSTT